MLKNDVGIKPELRLKAGVIYNCCTESSPFQQEVMKKFKSIEEVCLFNDICHYFVRMVDDSVGLICGPNLRENRPQEIISFMEERIQFVKKDSSDEKYYTDSFDSYVRHLELIKNTPIYIREQNKWINMKSQGIEGEEEAVGSDEEFDQFGLPVVKQIETIEELPEISEEEESDDPDVEF